jgi:hypothetical protein
MRSMLASALSIGLLVLAPSAGTLAAGAPSIPKVKLGHAMYDVGVPRTLTAADAAAVPLLTPALKTFKATVVDSGTTYTYRMVGKNPAIATSKPATTVTAQLVPLDIVFADGATWDPTASDSCDSAGTSPVARTQASPVFTASSWTWGGTAIGTGQYTDAFQRANFWTYAQPTGINPAYGVSLAVTTLPKVVVSVPSADSAETLANFCGNFLLGLVNINWLDNYLRKTVIPSLASQGVGPATLPIFLLHNVVEYIGSTSKCCVLGYHNAYKPTPTATPQTYALAMYDNSGDFSGSSDISALSHEVGEWIDDPFTFNPTRPWGHIGQVTGCQKNLEVGDPLTGTNLAVVSGTFTYHPQELAFFSWFYRQAPSLGVNGWYSNNGTFTTTQGTCV